MIFYSTHKREDERQENQNPEQPYPEYVKMKYEKFGEIVKICNYLQISGNEFLK